MNEKYDKQKIINHIKIHAKECNVYLLYNDIIIIITAERLELLIL